MYTNKPARAVANGAAPREAPHYSRHTVIFLSSLCRNLEPLQSDRKVLAMDQPGTNVTAPILSSDSAVWFSAYGFGWGYCAFTLPSEAVCAKLGAGNGTAKQLLLAFELGKRKLLKAVVQKALPCTGERIRLSADDL
ncbi:hypothetical protein [Paraburkholderia elongata]|nr:hypothetical protein [Paraburkholderia elongata]